MDRDQLEDKIRRKNATGRAAAVLLLAAVLSVLSCLIPAFRPYGPVYGEPAATEDTASGSTSSEPASSGSTSSKSASAESASSEDAASGTQASAEKAEDPNGVAASAAAVYCDNTGEMLYEKDTQTRYAPYSTTKILTALLAIQNLRMNQKVTVSKAAASAGGSTMGLVAGEKVSVRDLLYGMFICSGNDAAYALGEAVSGDMDSFVAEMNETAQRIGCKNTHFSNPNGVKNENNYTTAADFILIAKACYSNGQLTKIAGTPSYTLAATNSHPKARTIETDTTLLSDRSIGYTAVKFGRWDSETSFAGMYRKKGLTMYVVLLHDTAGSTTEDAKKLAKLCSGKVDGVKAVASGKEVGRVHVRHGAQTSVPVYTAAAGYVYLPKQGSKSLISTKSSMDPDVEAPLKKGDQVGTYDLYVGEEKVDSIPLVVRQDVETGWFPSYIGISNRAAIVLGVVLGAILLLFLILVIRGIRIRKKREKARREEIRRIAMQRYLEEEERKKRGWRY